MPQKKENSRSVIFTSHTPGERHGCVDACYRHSDRAISWGGSVERSSRRHESRCRPKAHAIKGQNLARLNRPSVIRERVGGANEIVRSVGSIAIGSRNLGGHVLPVAKKTQRRAVLRERRGWKQRLPTEL